MSESHTLLAPWSVTLGAILHMIFAERMFATLTHTSNIALFSVASSAYLILAFLHSTQFQFDWLVTVLATLVSFTIITFRSHFIFNIFFFMGARKLK